MRGGKPSTSSHKRCRNSRYVPACARTSCAMLTMAAPVREATLAIDAKTELGDSSKRSACDGEAHS